MIKRTLIRFGQLIPGRRHLIRSRLGRWVGRLVIDDPASLHAFWRQASPESNNPAEYVHPIGRSRILTEILADTPKSAHILEVGCNVGRNLAHLYDNGWRRLAGVEVNPHAVRMMRDVYPQLADVPVRIGAAEQILPDMADNSFDLIFTMAVLEHIHPDSGVVFDRISRIAPRLVAIEPKGSVSHRSYPHDVAALFRDRGMHLVKEIPLGGHPEADAAFADTSAWIFQRPSD